MSNKRVRLDVFLFENGLSDSREKARRDILSGWVRVNDETVREVSKTIKGTETVTVERPQGLFVSRGGEKLRKALDVFALDVRGFIAADLGASTGGFTDCLLKAGAQKVYAIDVGYGQLDFSIRQNEHVVVMERTNVRNLVPEDFEEKPTFLSIDLSFISVTKITQKLKELFAPSRGIMLIKPQFEAQTGEHKKGVVRKKEHHIEIVRRTLDSLSRDGLVICGLSFSPIKGPAGNIEFLLYFVVPTQTAEPSDNINGDELSALVEHVVEEAHTALS